MNYFPVAELKQRYSIGKQAELNRRKHLGIVPQKIDGAYVIREEQLSLLDRLDEFLNSKPGTKMTDFTDEYTWSGEVKVSISSRSSDSSESTGNSGPSESSEMIATLVESSESSPVSSSLAVRNDESEYMMELIETIAHAITPPNPIAHWERLAWLADNKIIVSTNEVQALTGTKPKGKEWTRGSFTFKRSGKLGTQYGWQT